MDGEKILAQCGAFYASNKRLIRYQKRFLSEELDDIPYSHLSSIGMARKPRRGLIWMGITVISFVLSSLATLAIVSYIFKSIAPLLGGSMGQLGIPGGSLSFDVGPWVPIHVVGLVIGIAMTAAGILVPNVFIQFRAPGLNKDAEARFRLQGARREASLNLVRIVRQQSLVKESELTDVRPAEDKGNQPPVQ